MPIDYSRRPTSASLKRAHILITEAYRILCDEVGATNPADNQFLRESVICARTRLTWTGERGGTDARTRNGEEVEIKTTRLDPSKGTAFPTSRYVSPTVIQRFKAASFWLLGVFDRYEALTALYRVEAADMRPEITRLERELRRRQRANESFQNNPKIPLARVHPHATVLFLARGYKFERDRLTKP